MGAINAAYNGMFPRAYPYTYFAVHREGHELGTVHWYFSLSHYLI